MTLDEMASAIQNNVGAGLKEVGNMPYSIDQIKDEISTARSVMILDLSQKGILNTSYFSQIIKNIKLTNGNFPEEGYNVSNQPAAIAKIPKLAMTKDNSAILYLGPTDMSLNIKTYYSLNNAKNHKYTRTLKNRPYAFADVAHDEDGDIPVYIFNPDPAAFREITVRAIVDDPVKLLQKDGYYIDDEEFPAPLAIQDAIITQITAKYIRYYKQFLRPNAANDQTDNS